MFLFAFQNNYGEVGSDLSTFYPFISSKYDDEALLKCCKVGFPAFLSIVKFQPDLPPWWIKIKNLYIRQQVYVSVNIMVRFDHSNESATGVSELNKSADWHLWTLMLMIVQTYLRSMQTPKSHQNVISKNLCSANLLTVVSIQI